MAGAGPYIALPPNGHITPNGPIQRSTRGAGEAAAVPYRAASVLNRLRPCLPVPQP